ncbi:E3 ubiquitin-protein ligase RNF217 isoform X1 [Manis javanica]|uniref:E3 ubiquitin-protein ligase RNF217 isoform X1 n=1 Tax=Manis javanica TaxID=9974 RepID=UPI00187A2392|nr:probable E3 ubiquitin-protein ligase RNF217 isoform X1 [Manis javanica]KAI5944402.1 putative E3 ubiquitin-protein ligase RNF217 [Manis javanica]
MGEEQSTVSGGSGSQEARAPAGGATGHPEPPRPRGDSAGAPGPRAASAEPSGGGCGSDLGLADASAVEPARSGGAPGGRKSPAPGQPAGLALTGPLNPQTLQQQLEEEKEEAGHRDEGGNEQQEAPPGEELEPKARVGAADGLVLDVLGQRRLPHAKGQVFCSVFCVEKALPEAPTAEQLSPPASPPRAPPVTNPPSSPSAFPSPRLSLPTDLLSPDGGSIELEFYLAPEPFSVPSLLGAPPYSGLGGVGDPYAPLMVLMCRVCLEDKPIKPLPCCKKAVCEECLKVYLSSQVQLGQVEIKCPITECFEFLEETTVIYNLTHEDSIKYKYFLELGRIDSSTKPCPQCKHFTTFKKKGHIPTPSRSESKYKIQCPTCQFVWCFKCHSPWHEGVNCKEYKKGDKLLRHWASEIEHGQRNAQKCPKCKIHIQRTEGCDHMTCSQCNTNFCYRCGERYRQLRFFGDHTSNLSIFGCKYRYLPERPHLRRLVRGSVCAGKLFVAPLILVLGLALGAIAVVIGLFVFPIYCLCKKQRKRSRTGMHW